VAEDVGDQAYQKPLQVVIVQTPAAGAYLAFCAKPPSPGTPAQLHHWLRAVLRN
jgi:hypothetical protein